MPSPDQRSIDTPSRVTHLGIMVLGLLAYLTGDWADDYDEGVDWGFDVHAWLGLAAGLFIVGRLLLGILGPGNARFSCWLPVTRERWRLVIEDVLGLATLKLPKRDVRQGVAGAVQAFGLLLFSWFAVTGFLLYLFLEPGVRSSGIIHWVEEAHEVGEEMIPIFLALHIGGALAHRLTGRNLFRQMFFIGRQEKL